MSESTSPDLTANQGVAYDGTHFYTSANNALFKFDAAWSLQTSNTDPIGDTGIGGTLNHCGDITVHDGKIYVPIEEFPNSPFDTQFIGVFDATDLSFIESFDISAQAREVSGIGYNPDDNLLYVSSFSSAGIFEKYTLAGVHVETMTANVVIASTQGVAFWRGYMWISSSVASNHSIYQYQTNGVFIGRAHNFAGFNEAEGLSPHGDQLITLQVDGSNDKNVYFLEE